MQKNLTFKGIVRNTDNLYAKDGECAEMVNLRIENGVAVPIAPPRELASLPREYKALYRHEAAGVYMCIAKEGGAVYLYDNDFKPLGSNEFPYKERLPLYSDVNRIEFMGNLVCFFTSTATLYALYDSGIYKMLGERPKMPTLSFNLYSHVQSVSTECKYRTGKTESDEDENLYWENASKGYFDECVSRLNAKGCYIDRALFRFAFRLFDGSYAFFSPIYYIVDNTMIDNSVHNKSNFISIPDDADASSTYYTVKVKGFAPKFNFSRFDFSDWENVIVSVDVFTSGSIAGHKLEADKKNSDGDIASPDVYQIKSRSEIFDEIASCALFYKVAEYSLSGVLVDSLANVSPSSLALSQEIGEESMSLVSRTADYTYVFNGRLHLAGLRETFFKGYDNDCFVPVGMNRLALSGSVYFELNTTDGVSIVRRDYEKLYVGLLGGEYYITPFLMYPDTRATKITFVLHSGNRIYRKSFPLTRHKTLNLAYYLNTNEDGIKVKCTGQFKNQVAFYVISDSNVKAFFSYNPGNYTLVYNNGMWMYNERPFIIASEVDAGGYYGTFGFYGELLPGDTITVVIEENCFANEVKDIVNIPVNASWEQLLEEDTTEEKNTVELRGNVLRVSAVDNPFTFPLAQTYTPSYKNIVAICSNTFALSQGQFGQHPLYVFCADGIWAMACDGSASLAYTTCYPLSREVCVNARSVKGIDSGVVFLTEKGLLLIEGGRVAPLSAPLESDKYTMQTMNKDSLIWRIAAIVAADNAIGNETFKEYCRDAAVGYVYASREIIVTNSNYPYSYIISLATGACYKYMYSFNFVSNSYPQMIAMKSVEGGSNVYIQDSDSGDNNILLVTRPLLWGTKLHKRIQQMMLHAVVVPQDDASHPFNGLACYLLCSNDGENFKIVAGSERRNASVDIVFPYFPTQSYRYFAVAIVGRVKAESRLVALEFDVGTAWNNRLS